MAVDQQARDDRWSEFERDDMERQDADIADLEAQVEALTQKVDDAEWFAFDARPGYRKSVSRVTWLVDIRQHRAFEAAKS